MKKVIEQAIEALNSTDSEHGSEAWEREKEAMIALEKLAEQSAQPLSDEQILHIQDTHVGEPTTVIPLDASDWIDFARAIEAAHGIKENT